MRRRLAHRWMTAGLLAATLLGGCGKPQRGDEEGAPAPGEALVGLMTEGELDRLATAMAAALRKSPVAASATRPLRLAPPGWRNATDVPVEHPAAFIDAFTGLVNDRVGANVQFLRRPWVRSDAAPDEVLASADFTSRISLMPPPKRSAPKFRLRTEVLSLSGTESLFSHDEEFELDPSLLDKSRRADRKREEALEKARVEAPVRTVGVGEIRFESDRLAERLRVTPAEPRRLDGGRLEFSARIASRRGRQKIRVQVIYYDAEGYQVEVSRPLLRDLRTTRPVQVMIASQLPAERYIALIDRY